MSNKSKPWKDNNGKTYPNDKLKIISKNWDNDTWYRFLRDDVYVYQREKTLSNPKHAEKCFTLHHNDLCKNTYDCNKRENIKKVLKALLNQLPRDEYKILKLIYWENKLNVEAANVLGISEVKSHRMRKRAEMKMGKLILEVLNMTFPANKFCKKP